MALQFAKLDRIDHNEPITKESNYEFLHHLQQSLLLAIREQGWLSPMEHRYAEECLKQQRRERSMQKQEGR